MVKKLFDGVRGKAMAFYRLYCLDQAGHISLGHWIEAHGDREAIGKVRNITLCARLCEIWQRDRLVAVIRDHELVS